MSLYSKLLVTVGIVFMLLPIMPADAQRRRSRRSTNKQSRNLRQTVTAGCVTNEETKGCFSDPLVPKPEVSIPFSKIRCSDCIIFGKPISRPVPCYPLAAKAARVAGEVKVHLVIDEEGKVVWAKAESGHPLLRQAAVSAACRARFTPARVVGQKIKVKVEGLLTYNFVLP